MAVLKEVSDEAYRQALALWGSGVVVVTTRSAQNTPVGFTVSAFSALSLHPPLVLFCLDEDTSVRADFLEVSHFGVNVLAEHQQALSLRFSSKDQTRFAGLEFEAAPAKSPWLQGCLMQLECSVQECLRRGDHWIVIGEVQALQMSEQDQTPLIHWQRQYHRLQ